MDKKLIPNICDPLSLFETWYTQAKKSEPSDPNAMCLATVNAKGLPSARMVLLKAYDARGFTFYTNYEGRKGQQIIETGQAALCFHWKSLHKQIRIEGQVIAVTPTEGDNYFATRDRGSQIGAWASKQSRPLEQRADFDARVKKYIKEFEGGDVPRPPHWSGFRVVPHLIEFWKQMPDRLHDRVQYTRDGKRWKKTRLYP